MVLIVIVVWPIVLRLQSSTPRTAHELPHLSCIAQAFKPCEDEQPPKSGGTCVAHVAPIAHSGSDELASVAPIAHPGQICADELTSIAQALKTCADELLSFIAQAGRTCAAHVAHVAHQ